jgi:hypothetical protein
MRRQRPLDKQFFLNQHQQDTGKDLFAMLFLVMMMLAQIFMMLTNEPKKPEPPQIPDLSGNSSETLPPASPKVGNIILKGNKVFIKFEEKLFNPQRDGAELITMGYTITSHDQFGNEVQLLYVDYDGIVDSKTLSRGLAPLRRIGINPYFTE